MTDIRRRGHPVRFGITTPQMWRSWDEMAELWSRAEASGWDGAFLVDHFMSDWNGEMGAQLEAFTMLGALAREVPRITLGSYVASVTHRPPAVLLKAALTVDHVSEGRFVFGIGAGWNDREHAAYGVPFPAPGIRVSMVDETLAALREFEVSERTTLVGEHLSLDEAPFEPKPVRGRLPVLVGSRKPRMLGVLARHGDLWDSAGGPDDVVRLGGALDEACRRSERDPDEISWMHEERSREPAMTPDELEDRVEALAPLGVSWFLVNVWPQSDPSVIERIGERLEVLRERWV
jgi:alkanesulfonate monooxygenase SsuD/methylene tetrahydromethanopterin reductase-like flavin-dependent oxidoreductase (luciferase family)